MAGSLLRKRGRVDNSGPLKFSYCVKSFGMEGTRHGGIRLVDSGLGDGKKVEEKFPCPGERVASMDTKFYKKGDVLQCECEDCHGPGRKRYPNYNPEDSMTTMDDETDETYEDEAELELEAAPDVIEVEPDEDETDEWVGESESAVVEAVSEPPLPSVGNPSDGESETLTGAVAPSQKPNWTDDGLARTETKRFHYAGLGEVVRMERPSVTKQGRDVVLVEWIAERMDGTFAPPQWSRKGAKDLL